MPHKTIKYPALFEATEQINQDFYVKDGTDPIVIVLASIGRMFSCDRVYICERTVTNHFDNTYEWCAPGIISEIDILQNQKESVYDSWYKEFAKDRSCIIQDVAELKDEDPALFNVLDKQNIHTAVVLQLIYRGTDYGFFAADNPDPDRIKELCTCFLEQRFLIAEMLRNRNLMRRLSESGYIDQMTKVGNRHQLYDMLDTIEDKSSIGIFLADIIGLGRINEVKGHNYGDMVIKETAGVIAQVFGMQNVFRVAGNTFMALYFGGSEKVLHEYRDKVRAIMSEKGIHIGCGVLFEKPWVSEFSTLSRRIDMRMYDDKRDVYRTLNDEEQTGEVFHAVLIADLDEEKLDCIYNTHFVPIPRPITFQEYMDIRKTNVHPDDWAYFSRFWTPQNIRRILRDSRHKEGATIVYRLLNPTSGGYVWAEEHMDNTWEKPDAGKIIVTSRAGHNPRSFYPVLDTHAEHDDETNASLTMYRGTDFFHRASVWMANTESSRILVISVDLNHFKLYNSIFGKQAGNHVLEMMQSFLQKCAHDFHGIAGYLGGDDFVLFVPLGNNSVEKSVEHGQLYIKQFDVPYMFKPHAGFYVAEDKAEPVKQMVEWATLALEASKERNDSNIHVFDWELFEQSKAQQLLMVDVERGLDKDEFTFYLQPKVNMNTGKAVSFEALVRWNKDGRVISPGIFIEQMEKAGIIHSLDMIILDKVCSWLSDRIAQGKTVIPVSINLSRVDFDYEDVVELVNGVVLSYNIDPKLVQVEVTESAFSEDDGNIQDCIDQLHEKGHTILLDDFGKGYSSLNSLHSMNFDVLKLDKKFVDAIYDEDDRQIVDSIIRMAHLIGLFVVAEGVETKEQADILLSLNCTYCQGYYFYKPLPIAEAEKLLDDTDKLQLEEPQPYAPGTLRYGNMNLIELIEENMISTDLLNTIIGPLAIYEITENKVHIMQMNEAYSRIIGVEAENEDERERILENLEESYENIRYNFSRSDENPGYKARAVYHRNDGTSSNLEASIYPLSNTEHSKFYLVWLREIMD